VSSPRNPLALPDIFVGIAISGGGSRAANFGAAVLYELETIGILRHATVISSVSGGSLASAYYGLARRQPDWSWEGFRKKLRHDFLSSWLVRLLSPHRLLLSVTSDFDRSDILADVFDQTLFKGARFGDLGEKGPQILINATEVTGTADKFVFNNVDFSYLRSDLAEYRLSKAVAASGAFPGVFDNVTLRHFGVTPFGSSDILDASQLAAAIISGHSAIAAHLRTFLTTDELRRLHGPQAEAIESELVKALNRITTGLPPPIYQVAAFSGTSLRPETKRLAARQNFYTVGLLNRMLLEDAFPRHLKRASRRYVHLLDGGAVDNLGTDTLKEAFRDLRLLGGNFRTCLFIVADAHVEPIAARDPRRLRDTRRVFDYGINTNALDALDALMGARREAQIAEWGARTHGFGVGKLAIDRDTNCHVWHLQFSRIGVLWLDLLDNPRFKSERKKNRISSMSAELRQLIAYLEAVFRTAYSTKTNYRLVDDQGCSPVHIQRALWDAARILVRDDLRALPLIYDLFQPQDGLDRSLIESPRVRLRKSSLAEARLRKGSIAADGNGRCPSALSSAPEDFPLEKHPTNPERPNTEEDDTDSEGDTEK